MVFWRIFSKFTKSFKVDDYEKITNVGIKYNDYLKAMVVSYFVKSSIRKIDHPKIEVVREVVEVKMKDVSMSVTLPTKPATNELRIPLDLNDRIWTFELEEEVIYLVTVIKSEFDIVMGILEKGNKVKIEGVNLKDIVNIGYRYEIYVTSKSDFDVIID